jgi:hypothetical protein
MPFMTRKEIVLIWADAAKSGCADVLIPRINPFVMALIAKLDFSLKSRLGRSLPNLKKPDFQKAISAACVRNQTAIARPDGFLFQQIPHGSGSFLPQFIFG